MEWCVCGGVFSGVFWRAAQKTQEVKRGGTKRNGRNSLSWKICGITPAREGVWSPGKAHGTVQADRDALRLLSKHGCAPSGTGWLLTRQVRAQHKKATILLDQLVSTEIRLCLRLVYFGCFISVGFKGTGVFTFLINSWDGQGNTIIPSISSLLKELSKTPKFWLSPWSR